MTGEASRPRIGVLALQGAVRPHVDAIRDVGADAVEVRLPRDLVNLDALILPGGESTTMRRLIDAYGLREPIASLARSGTPMFGTCAGMILLAERIAEGDDVVFPLLDIGVRRNGYGRQLDSFEADLAVPLLGPENLHGIFIRAPFVTDVGPNVEVLARDADGTPVAVRQGRVLATAFHPELTADRRLHRLLVEMVGRGAGRPA
ncbi:MAG: pyridoxal 5'-phosphate synthase glutaminase subunit PdxT [Candidatus Limnocylindria bacterium]